MLKAAVIPVTPLQQNCTLVWCDETMRGALIDPGGDVDRLVEAMEKQGVTLEKVLITHGHLDHAGGAQDLVDRFQVPIEGPHKDDKWLIDDLDKGGRQFGMTARSFTPDRWLEEGDTVSFGNVTMEVLHCPGHTPGHVIFFQRETMVAQVGDVLFQGSIGRTDFPKGNHDQLIKSITSKLWPLGNDVTFIPGHGALSTFGAERESNGYVADQVLASATP